MHASVDIPALYFIISLILTCPPAILRAKILCRFVSKVELAMKKLMLISMLIMVMVVMMIIVVVMMIVLCD